MALSECTAAEVVGTDDAATAITMPIETCPVQHVTVYSDRAEVSRTIVYKPTTRGSSGLHTIVVTGLTEAAYTDSIRVNGGKSSGGETSLACTIQEVSFDVVRRTASTEDTATQVSELQQQLRESQAKLLEYRNALARIKQQDSLVQNYMQSMLSRSSGENGACTQPTGNLTAVQELLQFHASTSADNDQKTRSLQAQISDLEQAVSTTNAQLSQLKTTAAATVASRAVSIVLFLPPAHGSSDDGTCAAAATTDNAPPGAAVTATTKDGCVSLVLTYIVSQASWVPSYDLRAELSGPANKFALTYYGVVRQSTGEDWSQVSLALSTATPAVGGTPPLPPTRTVQWKLDHGHRTRRHLGTMDARMRNTAVHQSSASNMMMPTQAMMMPMMNRRTSETMDAYDPTIEDSIDLSQSDSESVDDDEFAVGGADVATTVVKTGGAGASTFTIDRTANIAADNKEHKVTIAILSTLNPTYRHFATPDVEEKAYLQARAVNTSSYPLLASARVNLFIDGCFVTTTKLKHVSPGEGFNVFLGVDSSVKIEHRLVKKTTSKGGDRGMFRGKQASRLTREYRTVITNTNTDKEVTIGVVQVLPRSTDDKIKVELLTPKPAEVASSDDVNADTHPGTGDVKTRAPPDAHGGSAVPKGSDSGRKTSVSSRKDKDAKSGGPSSGAATCTTELPQAAAASGNMVIQNKITNNVVVVRRIAPSKKTDVDFHYVILWPHDAASGDVEIV
eukprot:m.545385 g.545385  ORF g.545385 m.545385 type:complete len:733 (-) comp22146_c0_seq5:387-2585(-)